MAVVKKFVPPCRLDFTRVFRLDRAQKTFKVLPHNFRLSGFMPEYPSFLNE